MRAAMGTRLQRTLWLVLLILLVGLVMTPALARAAGEGEKVVRVGWYESAFHRTDEFGRRSGYGYEYQQRVATYAGWNYEPVSPMRDLMKSVVEKRGNEYKEFAVHGGCECGVFKALNPKLDILTFGPIGSGAHTPEEKLDLASFDRSYEMLKEMVSTYVEKKQG